MKKGIPLKSENKGTYKVMEAIGSEFVKLNPALYLVKSPIAVSKAMLAPTESAPVLKMQNRLTVGLIVNLALALISTSMIM
jgi:hypothetical protein